ncbi:MAG: universal stress protein [Desulfobacterales bacterium]|jgi:nucleotide-binding universal stress UspA family protein
MFGKILVALKFSPSGLNAIDLAVRLSQAHGARLHVFHALDYHFKNMDDADPKMNEILANVRQRIKAELTPRLAGTSEVAIDYFPADPALEVCRIAGNIGADLIVVGCHQTHRRYSLGRVDYIGMTILEKAPCAVLLVPLIESFGSASGPDQPGQIV